MLAPVATLDSERRVFTSKIGLSEKIDFVH
jgi:hypothetical protein